MDTIEFIIARNQEQLDILGKQLIQDINRNDKSGERSTRRQIAIIEKEIEDIKLYRGELD